MASTRTHPFQSITDQMLDPAPGSTLEVWLQEGKDALSGFENKTKPQLQKKTGTGGAGVASKKKTKVDEPLPPNWALDTKMLFVQWASCLANRRKRQTLVEEFATAVRPSFLPKVEDGATQADINKYYQDYEEGVGWMLNFVNSMLSNTTQFVNPLPVASYADRRDIVCIRNVIPYIVNRAMGSTTASRANMEGRISVCRATRFDFKLLGNAYNFRKLLHCNAARNGGALHEFFQSVASESVHLLNQMLVLYCLQLVGNHCLNQLNGRIKPDLHPSCVVAHEGWGAMVGVYSNNVWSSRTDNIMTASQITQGMTHAYNAPKMNREAAIRASFQCGEPPLPAYGD